MNFLAFFKLLMGSAKNAYARLKFNIMICAQPMSGPVYDPLTIDDQPSIPYPSPPALPQPKKSDLVA